MEQRERYGFEAERFIDCSGEVLVISREHGRGRSSGASVSARDYAVLTIYAGKIARVREFCDEHGALEAAGLAD